MAPFVSHEWLSAAPAAAAAATAAGTFNIHGKTLGSIYQDVENKISGLEAGLAASRPADSYKNFSSADKFPDDYHGRLNAMQNLLDRLGKYLEFKTLAWKGFEFEDKIPNDCMPPHSDETIAYGEECDSRYGRDDQLCAASPPGNETWFQRLCAVSPPSILTWILQLCAASPPGYGCEAVSDNDSPADEESSAGNDSWKIPKRRHRGRGSHKHKKKIKILTTFLSLQTASKHWLMTATTTTTTALSIARLTLAARVWAQQVAPTTLNLTHHARHCQ